MNKEKLICIQGLRGWAIILIVLWHMNEIFPFVSYNYGSNASFRFKKFHEAKC